MKFIIVLGNKEDKCMFNRVSLAIEDIGDGKNDLIHDSESYPNITSNTSFIFSGVSPESEKMKEFAKSILDEKFPDDNLILENKSVDTVDNILKVKVILDHWKNCMRGDYPDEVVVCTSAFHVPRVEYICSKIIPDYKPSCIGTRESITEQLRTREKRLLRKVKVLLEKE